MDASFQDIDMLWPDPFAVANNNHIFANNSTNNSVAAGPHHHHRRHHRHQSSTSTMMMGVTCDPPPSVTGVVAAHHQHLLHRLETLQHSLRNFVLSCPAQEQAALASILVGWANHLARDPLNVPVYHHHDDNSDHPKTAASCTGSTNSSHSDMTMIASGKLLSPASTSLETPSASKEEVVDDEDITEASSIAEIRMLSATSSTAV